MKKLQEIDPSKLLLNPFVNDLYIEASRLTDSKKFIPDPVTGELLPATALVEKRQSAKIFYCTDCKQIIYNLSPGAKSLYIFVLYNLTTNQDWIQLNSQSYMTKNSVKSINTFKDAVKELCRYGFLGTTPEYKDVYWINPKMFFSGNRITKYASRVIIKGEFSQ
jgi:hypothetical protein